MLPPVAAALIEEPINEQEAEDMIESADKEIAPLLADAAALMAGTEEVDMAAAMEAAEPVDDVVDDSLRSMLTKLVANSDYNQLRALRKINRRAAEEGFFSPVPVVRIRDTPGY